jgi:hypothetical protein
MTVPTCTANAGTPWSVQGPPCRELVGASRRAVSGGAVVSTVRTDSLHPCLRRNAYVVMRRSPVTLAAPKGTEAEVTACQR